MKKSLHNARETLPFLCVITGINFLVFITEAATAGSLSNATSSSLTRNGGLYGPAVEQGDWWRIVTSGFLHASWGHFVSNMVALVFLGVLLGLALGVIRTTMIYLTSMLGGSLMVLLFSNHDLTVGASGAIFGLAGAGVVVAWHQRRWISLLLLAVWIGTNLEFTFATQGVSISGHLGGFITGALLARTLLIEGEEQLRSTEASFAIATLLSLLIFISATVVA